MNITKNQCYKFVTSQNNPYISILTFTPTTNKQVRAFQYAFLFDVFSCLTDTIPFILSRDKKATYFYTAILKEAEDNPSLYNCTQRELLKAYNLTFEFVDKTNNEYKSTKSVNEDIFKYGFMIFNQKFREDAYNLSINRKYFVDALLKISKNLEKFKK